MSLYHASTDTTLDVIEPRRTLSKDEYIGDYVFATASESLAAMYLATRGNATLMQPEGAKPYIVICNNPDDYIKNDKGGAIYKVPATSFKPTPQEGLEMYELVSETSVKPVDKTLYNSSIIAMRKKDVSIYFVDQQLFNQLLASKNEEKILSSIQPYFFAGEQ